MARKPDGDPLKVKMLINYAPQQSAAAAMAPVDASALVSILRTIAREPRIMKFSIVAFNLNDQRVVYRGRKSRPDQFPGSGAATPFPETRHGGLQTPGGSPQPDRFPHPPGAGRTGREIPPTRSSLLAQKPIWMNQFRRIP